MRLRHLVGLVAVTCLVSLVVWRAITGLLNFWMGY